MNEELKFFVKIEKNIYFFFFWGGGGGGEGRVGFFFWGGGGQCGCERRIEVFVKIQKKKFGGGGVGFGVGGQVDVI